MPRTRRTAAQEKTSWEKPVVLEGDPDGVAPPGKITKEEKEHLRGLQMSFTKRMSGEHGPGAAVAASPGRVAVRPWDSVVL